MALEKELAINTLSNISIARFCLSVLVSYVLSYIVGKLYVKNSSSFSDPELLARIFPLLSVTTTIIITVVKSSLALSLGLVGALSIVRFRTPIKEPEELVYIFLTIAIGLATGADQYLIAIIGTIFCAVIIKIQKNRISNKNRLSTMRLNISNALANDLSDIIKVIDSTCNQANLSSIMIKRNNMSTNMDFSAIIKISNTDDLDELIKQVEYKFPKSNCSLIKAIPNN